MSFAVIRSSPSGEVIEGLVIDLWPVWLPYLIGAVVLIGLGGWAAARGRAPWLAPVQSFVIPAVALGLLGWCALSLADAVLDGDGLSAFDRPIWQWMIDHRTAALTVLVKIVTEVGSTIAMTILAAAATAVLWLRRRRGDAILVVTVGVGVGLIITITKKLVGRQRPPEAYRLVAETNQSFPSGHALASTAILGVLLVLTVATLRRRQRLSTSRWLRPWLFVALAIVVIAFWFCIGVSRLYLGVHWSTDVLGGWASGLAWLLLCLTCRRLYHSCTDNVEPESQRTPIQA